MSPQVSRHLANQLTEDSNPLRSSLISGLEHPILCLHLLKVPPAHNPCASDSLLTRRAERAQGGLRERRDPLGGPLSASKSFQLRWPHHYALFTKTETYLHLIIFHQEAEVV